MKHFPRLAIFICWLVVFLPRLGAFTPSKTDSDIHWQVGLMAESFTPTAFGEPTTIGSSGSLGYNERGEVSSQSTASDTSSLEYYHGQVSKEEHTAGVLAGQTLIREYDEHDRLKTIKLPGDVSISYTYNDDGTLETVTTAGGVGGTWSNYDTITGKAKDFTLGPLSSSNVFDGLKRITSHTNSAAGSSYAYGYHYDADGHCDTRTTPEESWTFGYDSGTGYLFHATSSAGESFTYDFDDSGRHSGSVDYRPQVRINGTAVNIFGSVAPTASVTINNTAVTVNSTTGLFNQAVSPAAGWNQYTVKGTLVNGGYNGQSNAVAEKSYLVYLPPTSETLGYDLSGNRNGDARWTQTWNQLDQMTSAVENNPAPGVAAMSLNFAYDVGGRRVETQVYSGATLIQRVTTLWDGWLPAMDIEYDGSGAETDRRYYTWGPDVSGRIGGAGGIGGLLEVDERRGSTEFRSLPMNDGIGNVIGSVDGSTGERVATYQYGPFGEVVNVSGERASSCPFRYQSKRYEEQTGTYYFGKRYYEPKTQTWWSRDPKREDGGVNLYAYCQNDPVGNFDPVGLSTRLNLDGSLEFDDSDPTPSYLESLANRTATQEKLNKLVEPPALSLEDYQNSFAYKGPEMVRAFGAAFVTLSGVQSIMEVTTEMDLAGSITSGSFQYGNRTSGAIGLAMFFIPGEEGFSGLSRTAGMAERSGMGELSNVAGGRFLPNALERSSAINPFYSATESGGRMGYLAEGEGIVQPFSLSSAPTTPVQVAGRLTPGEMRRLTEKHGGVEFAQFYRIGAGKNGGGGTYWLTSGSGNRVAIPQGMDIRLISHTHPSGSIFASPADRAWLETNALLGSPQRASRIIPIGRDDVSIFDASIGTR